MKHLISSRTALCLCGLTLCFNASAQGYVSYNHDAAKMNQITVQEIGAGGLTPAFYYDALHNSYQKSAAKKNKQYFRTMSGVSACQQVDVADAAGGGFTADSGAVRQVQGGSQHLGFAGNEFGARPAQKHPMLR